MTSASAAPNSIVIYDTLEDDRRPLKLLSAGKCGIYCCGPTVYDMSHIGHARAALVPDIIVRFLRHEGLAVTYVRNITDIDDKIIARSHTEGITAEAVAAKYTEEYHRDLAELNILAPDIEPKVSEHIPPIIALVETLIARDLAYAVAGDVYYRVARFAGYGKLSKRSLEEMNEGAGSRVEVDTRKESPLDFALWKAAKPGEPAWESPWGPGRPGWHIECSAMSSTHLGDTFDIHGGGRDLIFPHHENEIAQSQGAHGEGTFARYWVHNGFINFAGEKMSKSLGNFFTIREILTSYSAEALRYFLLTVHYRHGLNFEVSVHCPGCRGELSAEAQDSGHCAACGRDTPPEQLKQQVRFPGLEDADDRVAYVYKTLRAARSLLDEAKQPAGDGPIAEVVAEMLPEFLAAMRQDFNTPAALGVLSKPLAEINTLLAASKGIDRGRRHRTVARFMSDLQTVNEVLGCFGQDPDSYLAARGAQKARRLGLDVATVERLLAERTAARQTKDWEAADRLRDEITAMGVTIKDGPTGSTWDI